MTWLAGIVLSGLIPAALPAPARVLWIGATGGEAAAGCAVQTAGTWTCDSLPPAPQGVIVIIDAGGTLAYVPVGQNLDGRGGVASWGRVLQIAAGGAGPEDLHHIQIHARKPDRPVYRAATQRFRAIDDTNTHVVALSDTAFWVAGQPTDKDAYLLVEGPAIATIRIAVSVLSDGPPEWPVVEDMEVPRTMRGRVETADGEDVEGATVELFEPLHPLPAGDVPKAQEALLKRATTNSQVDGTFTFDGLASGRYHVAVVHPSLGRAEVAVKSLGAPVTIRLVAPAVARGRVLRNMLPVPDARVRFIPDVNALLSSTDPTNHIAEETTTAADGRFVLALPPDPSGTVQIIGPDEASVRVPVLKPERSRDVSLGDITLPERRRVGVMLLDGEGCALSAVGPFGHLGLATVQATVEGPLNWLDLPEGGEWALTADCNGQSREVLPRLLAVPPSGADLVVDARVVR